MTGGTPSMPGHVSVVHFIRVSTASSDLAAAKPGLPLLHVT